MNLPPLSWRLVALLAIGGALGTVARHLVSGLVPPATFPWGTLAVNVSGSLLLGLFMSGAVLKGHVTPGAHVTIGVAFFGAYTTMSTFAYETSVLLENAGAGHALLNVALNPGLCLVGVALGQALGAFVPA